MKILIVCISLATGYISPFVSEQAGAIASLGNEVLISPKVDFLNIVDNKIKNKIKGHKKNEIVCCGIELDVFYLMKKGVAREVIVLDQEKKHILFS